jgi:hypothetical protein
VTVLRHGEEGAAGAEGTAPAPYRAEPAAVLADRMAAALVHHGPGWRLPRLTALARRYSVSTAEVDAAIDELAGRHLLRRLPDGQVYRASPAEYWVPLAGVSGLASHVDPMGGRFACKTWNSSRRRPPEDIGRSLGLAAGETAIAVRCLWTVGGEPAALSASYLAGSFPGLPGGVPLGTDGAESPPGGVPAGAVPGEPLARALGVSEGARPTPRDFLLPCGPEMATAALPQAVQLEMGLPPPSAARSLRMTAGEPVATVTVSFADPATGARVAVTTAMLRPDLFRIVLASPGGVPAGSAGGSGTTWTRVAGDWEP